MDTLVENEPEKKRKYQLIKHPWTSLLAFYGATIVSTIFTGVIIFGILGLPDDSPWVQFTQAISYHILTVFILVHFFLQLPKGKRKFKQYLEDIGLSWLNSFSHVDFLMDQVLHLQVNPFTAKCPIIASKFIQIHPVYFSKF